MKLQQGEGLWLVLKMIVKNKMMKKLKKNVRTNDELVTMKKWKRVRTQGLDWLPNLKTVRDD